MLKKQGKAPKYDMYYSVEPLLEYVRKTSFSSSGKDRFTDATILTVRLTTLFRSSDVAEMACHFWEDNGSYYVKARCKGDKLRTSPVAGLTLHLLVCYMYEHRLHPNIYFFRHIKNPSLCLSADRIAKRVLGVMEGVGIDTSIFKAHSVRGASTTELLKTNPKGLVKNLGGWSTEEALDGFYNQLHMLVNWDALLLGTPAQGVDPGEVANQHHGLLPAPCPSSVADEGRREDGAQARQQDMVLVLTALGLISPLFSTLTCHACGLRMKWEATYTCSICLNLCHVRCLSLSAEPQPSTTPRGGKRLGLSYFTTCCSSCTAEQGEPSPPVGGATAPAHSSF